jgi:hypothetical protein
MRKLLLKTLQAGKDLVSALVICELEISDGAIIKCNYKLCVKVVNKSNIQSKTPSRVTHTCDNLCQKWESKEPTSVEMESVAVLEAVPKGEAAVKTVRALNKWCGDWHLAVGCH